MLTKIVPVTKRALSQFTDDEWGKYETPHLPGLADHLAMNLGELGLVGLDLDDSTQPGQS